MEENTMLEMKFHKDPRDLCIASRDVPAIEWAEDGRLRFIESRYSVNEILHLAEILRKRQGKTPFTE